MKGTNIKCLNLEIEEKEFSFQVHNKFEIFKMVRN